MKDKFYKLIIHREHLLLIDYLLNNINQLTNMPHSISLSKELKQVTSSALQRAPKIYEIEIEE